MSSPPVGSQAWQAQDKGPIVVGLCWTFSAISSLFVAARIWVRGSLGKKLKLDDYLLVAASFFSYTATIMTTLAVTYGYGRHTAVLSIHQLERAIFYTIFAFTPGILSFALPKLAAIYLLTRLLNPSKKHKWFLWFMGIWTCSSLLVTCGLLLGRCNPPQAQWDFTVRPNCLPPKVNLNVSLYASSLSAALDFYLGIWPTVVLWKLQLNRRKKFALSCTLGLGFFSGMVATYKVTKLPTLLSPDFIYDSAYLTLWTIIEGAIIIIVCTIPLLQPLLQRLSKRNPFRSQASVKLHPYKGSSRGTNPSDFHHKYDVLRASAISRDDEDFDFHFASAVTTDRHLAPKLPARVVSWPTKASLAYEPGSSRKNLEPSETGGILMTKVVTVTFSGKDSLEKENKKPVP